MTKKIAVIGPHSCGKSSLILKYIKKSYTDSYLSTMWADCFVDSQSNHVWDTPGAARFSPIQRKYVVKSTVMYYVSVPAMKNRSIMH